MRHSFSTALKLVKKYSRRSVFFEYFKKLLLLITLPFLLVLTSLYYYHQRVIHSEIETTGGRNFEKAVLSANTMFDELFNISLAYGTDSYVNMFLSSSAENHIKDAMGYSVNVRTQMIRTMNTSQIISNVQLYSPESRYVFAANTGNGFIDDFSYKSWFEYYEKTGATSFIIRCGGFYNNTSSLFVSYGLSSPYGNEGLIVFELDPVVFDSLLLGTLPPSANEFCLLGENQEILYSSSRSNSLSPTAAEIVSRFNAEDASADQYKKDDMMYFIEELNTTHPISLAYFNDLHESNESLHYIWLLFIVCVLISTLGPLGISLYISSNFYNAVTNIVTTLNVDDTESAKGMNEFAFITKHIVDIVKKNKDIETELAQRASSFKQAQAIALQTQLNPHFLFNTLNLISLSARNLAKGNNTVSITVSLLADLLSFALDTHNYFVPIREEITYAEKYLEIQKIKHKNNFDCVWDIDDTVLERRTIKLVLQPLIENSFQHAISLLEDKRGVITISAKDEGDRIVFGVADNGGKIPDHKLMRIQDKFKTEDLPQKGHIGLANINLRIKLVYGDDYGVQIKSDENGTVTYITFPKE